MVRASQRLGWGWVAVAVTLGSAALVDCRSPDHRPDSSGAAPSDSPAPGGTEANRPSEETPDSVLAAAEDRLLRGELPEALAAYERAEVTARNEHRSDLLATSLSGQGVVHKRRGDYYQALTLYSQPAWRPDGGEVAFLAEIEGTRRRR